MSAAPGRGILRAAPFDYRDIGRKVFASDSAGSRSRTRPAPGCAKSWSRNSTFLQRQFGGEFAARCAETFPFAAAGLHIPRIHGFSRWESTLASTSMSYHGRGVQDLSRRQEDV